MSRQAEEIAAFWKEVSDQADELFYTNPPMPEDVGGTKHDVGKPRMDLLPSEALEEVAKVLTFGAQKYDAHNWRKGVQYSRLTAALLRHLGAWQRGEDLDPESGLSHIAHAACNAIFLLTFISEGDRLDLDDRYRRDETSRRHKGETNETDKERDSIRPIPVYVR